LVLGGDQVALPSHPDLSIDAVRFRALLAQAAAQSVGASSLRVMLRHIAPNIAAPIVVLAAMTMTSIILLESSLSFLGLGIQPPTLAWGAMVGDGRNYLHTAWWIGVFPGAAIMLLTMAISLIGDWLRDVLDPTLRGL